MARTIADGWIFARLFVGGMDAGTDAGQLNETAKVLLTPCSGLEARVANANQHTPNAIRNESPNCTSASAICFQCVIDVIWD